MATLTLEERKERILQKIREIQENSEMLQKINDILVEGESDE